MKVEGSFPIGGRILLKVEGFWSKGGRILASSKYTKVEESTLDLDVSDVVTN